MDLKKELDDVKIIYIVMPCMKRQKINLVKALRDDSLEQIDLSEGYEGIQDEVNKMIKKDVENSLNDNDKKQLD